MGIIVDGIKQAFLLLIHGDKQMLQIAWLSLVVSGTATILSLLIGIPLGSILGLAKFPGRRVVVSLVNTGMGAPPVVVGLIVSIFLWRQGLLGFLHLMYSPGAMIIAQFIIAFPIVAGFTLAAVQQLDPKLKLQIIALGVSKVQMVWQLLLEARLPLMAAVMAGFGAGREHEIPNPGGYYGKTVDVSPPPDWKPKFLPPQAYEPAKEKARANMRQSLEKLIEAMPSQHSPPR